MREVTCAMANSATALFAKFPDKLASFYEAVLSAELTQQEGVLQVLNDGTELLILSIPAEISDEINISTPPTVREDVAFKPIFEVTNLNLATVAAESAGGTVTPRAFRFNGFDHVDIVDIERNVVQLRARSLS